MHKKIYVVLIIMCSAKGFSQERNFFNSNYTFVPSRLNQVDFNHLKIQVNIPVKSKLGMFTNSLTFNHYKFNYDSNLILYTQSIRQLYRINYGVNYLKDLSDTWKMGARFVVGTQSNFQSKLSDEDFNLGGGLFFMKQIQKEKSKSQWVFGINYTNALGEQRLLPMIGYSKHYSSGSSFAIGFPNTFYKYQLDKKNSVKILAEAQGFYMNIADNPIIDENTSISKASFLSGLLGLEFNRKIDDNWTVVLKTSYSFLNEYSVLDLNENEIYDFNLSPVLYISTGIKFNLLRK